MTHSTPLDALKAAVILLFAALAQVSVLSTVEVAEGHLDLVLVLVVSIALLEGPTFGAAAGFWAGLVLDVSSLETLGLTSLLLTLAGYFAGRFGDVTSRTSAHPPLVAVVLATIGVGVGAAVIHFMLGSGISAAQFFAGVLLPGLALNMLFAYPVFRLVRRLFTTEATRRREVGAAV